MDSQGEGWMCEWRADPRKPMTLITGVINNCYYAIPYAVMA